MSGELRSIVELARAMRARETSAADALETCLVRIAESDPSINAFITVLDDEARAQAREADRELTAGHDRGPLHGIPVSIKDIIDLRGASTTAASAVRREHMASEDALAVARLRAAGAVFVGKTNLHEFALGTTNEDSAYGPVRHPLDPTRSPGGSSGGSAASVLAGMAYASVGTDTGGSVRIPAAACGLVGLKPAWGEVPTHGIVPLSTTLDHVGPLCRSVDDASLLYDVLRGAQPRLPQGSAAPPRLRPLRFGVPVGYLTARLDVEVRAAFDRACRILERAGAVIDLVAVPHAADGPWIYQHIALPEVAAYHAATLESRPADYSDNVRARLELGRSIPAEDHMRALHARDVLVDEVDAALEGRDALLMPTLAVPATPLGAATMDVDGVDEPVRAITLRLTQLFNLTGHPAITLPCGRVPGGLPVGAQIVAKRTPDLLDTARTVEALLAAA